MHPKDYLEETFHSVKSTLSESLRFDYGPNYSIEFFTECSGRLDDIEKEIKIISSNDYPAIAARIGELELLANWIALIERSHLGEFSWPFADYVRSIAALFLADTTLSGLLSAPIIHIVAEGSGYQIQNERRIPATTGRRRLAVIKFPRQFKEAVLLHSLFGHELGHTAVFTSKTGSQIKTKVLPVLFSGSPVQDATTISAWLNRPDAPSPLFDFCNRFRMTYGRDYQFPVEHVEAWQNEYLCDLFGLVLFGPSFVASHKALILSSSNSPFDLILSHPPYATRHKMLVSAMRQMNWSDQILTSLSSEQYLAEQDYNAFILDDPYDAWALPFTDASLLSTVNAIRAIIAPYDIEYERPSADKLNDMIDRLQRGIPPTVDQIDDDGIPHLKELLFAHILDAGWIYWIGRTRFSSGLSLTFEQTNRLCHQALVQQTAINHVLSDGVGS